MIRQHPLRVLGVTALIAIAFLALSYPGRNDTKGAWYYVSAIGWFGFLLGVLAFVVLGIVAAVTRTRRHRVHGG
jgi:hypothetical protein